MYAIRNVIESASNNSKEKLDILIINEFHDNYIKSLCLTGHNFYLLENNKDLMLQWTSEYKPQNLSIVKSLNDIRTLDCIVCFNRGQSFVFAETISNYYHVNVISIDSASSQLILPSPINTTVNVTLEDAVKRQGVISVGTTKHITQSWINNLTGFPITIPHYYDKFESNNSKILIDDNIPQEILKNLPFNLSSENYTVNKSEACVYLHLWTHINKLMIDCLASKIPVACIDSPDIRYISANRACIIIPKIEDLAAPQIKEAMLNAAEQGKVADHGMQYVKQVHDNQFFLKCWDKLFYQASNLTYLRG